MSHKEDRTTLSARTGELEGDGRSQEKAEHENPFFGRWEWKPGGDTYHVVIIYNGGKRTYELYELIQSCDTSPIVYVLHPMGTRTHPDSIDYIMLMRQGPELLGPYHQLMGQLERVGRKIKTFAIHTVYDVQAFVDLATGIRPPHEWAHGEWVEGTGEEILDDEDPDGDPFGDDTARER